MVAKPPPYIDRMTQKMRHEQRRAAGAAAHGRGGVQRDAEQEEEQ